MKSFKTIAAASIAALSLSSCEDFLKEKTPGELRWHFAEEAVLQTRASETVPDTDSFLIQINDASGKTLYSGRYRDSPEVLPVDPGSYTVSVVSENFKAPMFDKPVYGDEKTVVVKSGESVSVELGCKMVNAGVRLNIDEAFLKKYQGCVLYLKSADGREMYSYNEKRFLYFNPGTVSLVMTENSGPEQTLLTRVLAAQDMLTLHISVPSETASGSRFSIVVDTVKNRFYEQFVIGSGSGASGNDINTALSVAQAKTLGETGNVWIKGYIVGGDLSSSGKSISTGPTFSKSTHLAIADRTSVTEKASCIAVELKSGGIRDALNLADHPDLKGRLLYIRGDLVNSYFGTTGLKNAAEFELR